jgi:hypothetical protein
MSITLQAAVTAVALTYPTPDRGEPPDARAARLDGVSGAVVQAAERATCQPPWDLIDEPCRPIWPGSTVGLTSLVWSLGYLESGYAEWIHEGRCRSWECDAGRARSPWQLQRTLYTEWAWHELEGVGEYSTFVAAWSAVRVVAASRSMCRFRRPNLAWLPATISAYATGGHCDYPRAGRRAAFVLRVEGRVRELLQAGIIDLDR